MLTQPGLVSAAGGLCAPCGSAACLWRVLLLWGAHAWGQYSLEALGREHMAFLGSLAHQQPAYPVGRGRHGFGEGKGRGPQHCVSSSQKLSPSAPRLHVLLWTSQLPCKAQDLAGRSLELLLDCVPTATAFSAQGCRQALALGRPSHPVGSREGEGGCSGGWSSAGSEALQAAAWGPAVQVQSLKGRDQRATSDSLAAAP